MAKNWVVNEDRGILTRSYTVKELDANLKETWVKKEKELVIDLTDLFPDFLEMEAVQKSCIVNGIKQKIDDCIARSKDMTLTEKEKREEQSTLWKQISEERTWNVKGSGKGRAGSVSLKLVVPEFQRLGLSAEKIAALLSRKVEEIQKFIDTGIDETEEEETEE